MTDLYLMELEDKKRRANRYISSNEMQNALSVYLEILKDNPEDCETYLLLGDLYRELGDEISAIRLFAKALLLDPSNTEIVKRIQQTTTSKSGSSDLIEEVKPEDTVANQLREISGQAAPVSETDIQKATRLLEEILRSNQPAQVISNKLSEIDTLLPALIELNIRQARVDGRPDLAQGLQALQTNIALQKQMGEPARDILAEKQPASPEVTVGPTWFTGNVLVLSPGEGEASPRMQVIADSISSGGCHVTESHQIDGDTIADFDLVIASQPHPYPDVLEGLASLRTRKIPLILDLESDFEQLPVNHPDYEKFGLGTAVNSRSYMTSLLLANVITVPSENLAISLKNTGYPAVVMPDGWSKKNPLWDKPSYPRITTNIGWVGMPGQHEEVLQIRRVILRILHEFPDSQLVVTNDPGVYQLFESVPEPRRLFLPSVEYEDYPYMLGQIDILMLPLRNIPFNRALSDRLLVEAGAKGIPWLASPVPSFTTWQKGGLITTSLDEWHTNLRQLLMDAGLRRNLGNEGKFNASKREAGRLGLIWQNLIQKVIRENSGLQKEKIG